MGDIHRRLDREVMEEGRSVFKILTGTPTRKRPLGRARRRWEDITKMYLKEIGINKKNWVDWTIGLRIGIIRKPL